MRKLAIFGGRPVRTKPFPNRKSMGKREISAVTRVLKSDILSGFIGGPGPFFNGGNEVREFENLWSSTYNFKHAISVNSWTSGLQVAIGAVGIGPGDEVICSPYTMSASSTAVLFYGGIPVFADVDQDRFTLCPIDVESKITTRTKAILVVHLFGYPADMDAIMNIARKYNLKVIEDAAQAPGVYYKGRPVGTIGDIGGFSLNFHKHIHTGEGGILVTNCDEIALRCQLIRNHGENVIKTLNLEDISNTFGGNYRLTEIQAAIGSEQFANLESILNHRLELGEYLTSCLKDFEGLTSPVLEEGSTHAFYMYPIKYKTEHFGVSRNLFLRAVSAELPIPNYWDTTPLAEGYVEPTYLSPIYQNKIAMGRNGFPFNYNADANYNYSKGLCPVAERLYERELLLTPLVREGIFKNDIDALVDAFEKVIDNIDQLKYSDLSSTEMFDAVNAINKNVKL